MKYSLIFLIFSGLLFSLIPQSDALVVSKTSEELYENSDMIVFGEILDYADLGHDSLYDIKVIRYLKNPQSDELIQAIGSGVHSEGIWVEDSTVFEIGEKAILYLEKDKDNSLRIGPYSFSTEFDIDNPYWYYPYRWIMILSAAVGIIGFLVWRKRKRKFRRFIR